MSISTNKQKAHKNEGVKSIKIAIAIALIITLILGSCSKEDDDAPQVINANDLIETIDENPMNGAVIGTITTNIPGTFSIISQNPNGAFAVDSQTGEVTVANAALFDFETNQTLEAVVVATGTSSESVSSVRVSLNNIDDIAFLLTTSAADYAAASDGDWIGITPEEFDLLAVRLNNVSKAGATDNHYNQPVGVFSGAAWTRGNTTQPSMPAGSLLFAFRYKPNNGSGSGTKVKLSTTSATQGYADIGTPFPANQGNGSLHYLLKGNDTPTEAPGFLCIFNPSGSGGINGVNNFSGDTAGQQTINKEGDQNNLSDGAFVDNWVFYYQGLSTTQKQWD